VPAILLAGSVRSLFQ